MIQSAVICAVLLVVLHGNVFAGISFERKIESTNEDAKIFPYPSKLPASTTSHSGRIINGYEGRIEYFPFIVHLRVDSGNGWMSGCGASIISYTYAFTAAHCVSSYNPSSITLYGGNTSKRTGGIEFPVSGYAIHPNYNLQTSEYDVALLQVRGTFQGYRNVVPIALQDAEVPAGTLCYAVGWGCSNLATSILPKNVRFTYLPALSPQQCSQAWPSLSTIICAKQGNGVNICNGNSRGPLVCNGKLTGASLFATNSWRSDVPAAFAKVTNPSIRQFIRQYAGV